MPVSIARRALFATPLLQSLPAFADDAVSSLRELERRNGGRLGVALLDTASGRRVAYRGDERFPMCSTFKFLAAALILARVDRGEEKLDRRIVFAESDLVPYSLATKEHVGAGGMTVDAICAVVVFGSGATGARRRNASLLTMPITNDSKLSPSGFALRTTARTAGMSLWSIWRPTA